MLITYRQAEDEAQLTQLIKASTNAKQRDRYRTVQLAIAGNTAPQIAQQLARSRRFVQRWVYAYRDGGMDALVPKSPTGRKPKLSIEQQEAFKQRVLDVPTQDDGVCTLRGVDFIRILHDEFGVDYQLSGVYLLLNRLGLSVLQPRPQHRKSDPQAMTQWQEDAPFLSEKSKPNTPIKKSPSGSRTKPASVSKAP